MSGIFYVMKDGDAYKLGITKNSAEERRKALQTGNPRDLEVFYEFKANDPRAIETELHKFFEYCEIDTGGDEWFEFKELSHLNRKLNQVVADGRMYSTGLYNGEVNYWVIARQSYMMIPAVMLLIAGIILSIWSGVFL